MKRIECSMRTNRFLICVVLLIAALFSAFLSGFSYHTKAYAQNSNITANEFKVNSIKVLNPGPLTAADTLIVEMDIEAPESGFKLSDLQFYAASEEDIYGENSASVVELKTNANGQLDEGSSWPMLNNGALLYSGKHVIALSLEQCHKIGNWQIQLIQIGTGNTIYKGGLFDTTMGSGTFTVTDKATDISAPMLQGIKAYPSLQGEKVKMKLVCIEPSGLKRANIRLKSIDGTSYATADLLPPANSGSLYYNNYDVEVQLPYNAKLGDWVVECVELEDKLGNMSKYALDESSNTLRQTMPRQDMTDALNATLFTVSQPVDTEVKIPAPSVTSFEILNDSKTIHRPGLLKIRLGVHEESGVGASATIKVKRRDGQSSTSASFDSLKTGVHTLDVPIPASAYLGTWTIEVQLGDKFGNVTLVSPSVIKGADGLLETQIGKYESSTGTYPLVIGLPEFNVADEFDYAFNSSLSYPYLIEQIKNMTDGKAARIRIDGSGILPAAVFDAIRGTNKIVVCWSGAYQWVFRGAAITGTSKDIDLALQIGRMEASDLNSTEPAVKLDFKPNGNLPGKSEVRFKSDYLYKFANVKGNLKLFYVQGSRCTKENTKFDLVFDGTDKWCHVDISHNSTFLITTQNVSTIKAASAPLTPQNLTKATVSVKDKTYTGKAQKATAVTVKFGEKTLKLGRDFTISSKSGKNIGTYKVTITGIGAYTGTKTATFKIVPKGTSVSKLTKGKKAFTVKWKKPSKANLKQTTGYQVRWSTAKSMKGAKSKTVKATSSTGKKCTLKVGKLKANKKYYVQVRTYKKVGGKMYYSSWSKAKTVKTKK